MKEKEKFRSPSLNLLLGRRLFVDTGGRSRVRQHIVYFSRRRKNLTQGIVNYAK